MVLLREHLARFAVAGAEAEAAFRAFAAGARPGVWSLRWRADGLEVTERAGSGLVDGMPVRFAVSPFAGRTGAFAKRGPPSPYDAVRLSGVATLLTSADGSEIYESCIAAVVGWDGTRFVLPPEDRPRVRSTSEAVLVASLEFRRAPIAVGGDLPLLLVNAVKGPCVPAIPGRPPPPREAVERLAAAFSP